MSELPQASPSPKQPERSQAPRDDAAAPVELQGTRGREHVDMIEDGQVTQANSPLGLESPEADSELSLEQSQEQLSPGHPGSSEARVLFLRNSTYLSAAEAHLIEVKNESVSLRGNGTSTAKFEIEHT